MKKEVLIQNVVELTINEKLDINGGDTPGQNTSFANDASYYTVYAVRCIWSGLKAFGSGARSGQEARFSG